MPDTPRADRRAFLRNAGTLAAAAVAAPALDACERATPAAKPDAGERSTSDGPTPQRTRLDDATLAALGEVVLPGTLGAAGRRQAVVDFTAWVKGYVPVAEEMHGYGYADVRYLPADPAPGWQAQLAGLDTLARHSRGQPFAALAPDARRQVVEAALRDAGGDRLPSPLARGTRRRRAARALGCLARGAGISRTAPASRPTAAVPSARRRDARSPSRPTRPPDAARPCARSRPTSCSSAAASPRRCMAARLAETTHARDHRRRGRPRDDAARASARRRATGGWRTARARGSRTIWTTRTRSARRGATRPA